MISKEVKRQFVELIANLKTLNSTEFARFVKKIEQVISDLVPDLVDPYGASVIADRTPEQTLILAAKMGPNIRKLLKELKSELRVKASG